MANDARSEKPVHHEPKFVITKGWDRKVPGPFYGLMELMTVNCEILERRIVMVGNRGF